MAKLAADVRDRGLGLVVVADWYNLKVIENVAFTDENTNNYWWPETGGANVPAMNKLLRPLGVEFAAEALDGSQSRGH